MTGSVFLTRPFGKSEGQPKGQAGGGAQRPARRGGPTGVAKYGAAMFGAVLGGLAALLLLAACDTAIFSYGRLGGADQTETYYPGEAGFRQVMRLFSQPSGVWYSHYAGIGRLDGYRVGTFGTGAEDFDRIMGAKEELFPAIGTDAVSGASARAEDYFVFYDDTVYGQRDTGEGGNGGWDGLSTRYVGIVRAVNVFNGDPLRGAIIIEYLQGCVPGWLDRWPASREGRRPFFGIYYRVLDANIIQMANAVDLSALYAGKPYYTEQESLPEAIAVNGVENEAEFIAWGIVIPQDREQ